ncbi:hypothetical protein [Martelella sp. AMO21009]
MAVSPFEKSVFINCPFDEAYAPLLEAALFCIVYFGFVPRLATERLEAGENRLDKIIELMRNSQYSIHDLSRCRAREVDECFRMNMPFEYGADLGLRRSGSGSLHLKKFLIFERDAYDLKAALSDAAGQDVAFHRDDYELVIKHVRDFFKVEAALANVSGPALIKADYETFLGWMTEKKIYEGHSEKEALNLPTSERLEEMRNWIQAGNPERFIVAG